MALVIRYTGILQTPIPKSLRFGQFSRITKCYRDASPASTENFSANTGTNDEAGTKTQVLGTYRLDP